jgi:adenylate cyclase class 2
VSAPARYRETEVKIAVQNQRALRERLRRAHFVVAHQRALEDNVLFDTPQRALRQIRAVLRIRHFGTDWSVTFKGTPDAERRYKSRLEVESGIENPEAVEGVFRVLGLVPVFRYQKYRTQFVLAADRRRSKPSIEVAFDETPIGDFIELEGSPRAIDRTAKALGYSRRDYSTASYGSLYLADCIRKNVAPSDMTFAGSASKKRSRKARIRSNR